MPALHQPPNWTLSICYEMHDLMSLDCLAQVGEVSDMKKVALWWCRTFCNSETLV
jgi:hypothetical protein